MNCPNCTTTKQDVAMRIVYEADLYDEGRRVNSHVTGLACPACRYSVGL